ncbi:MAG: KpsF/GutQ family sugar-phosphate isomerase [Rickettsiales bacterium]|nr:KpsF/GutQ family sugar-phosphate isomerase [Rickettsiales bacterium]|tara:strand:+ start:340 stop:1296 length:957 start_codon:yes stop_codon:yes gene_type:complete
MQDQNNFIHAAKKCIETEITGLKSLLDFFGDDYINAINLIINCQGKIIISGMGKSGHIASKIAATLSSTGTPAFFIHPGEASHGDLGMITKNDIVILLSNSGETKELKDIIYYCKRFSIPIIGIIRRKESELTAASDVALILPAIAEANLVNAPTTSTTMMLALGDAIACSLIDNNNFSKEQFGIFHPGGKLGSNFLKVKDIMRKKSQLPLINQDAKFSEALIEMTKKCLGCTGIIDDNKKLIGIITDGDIRRHIDHNIISQSVKNIMTKNPITVQESSLAAEALGIMNDKSITSIFVLNNNNHISGIIHIHDCLKLY